MADTTVLDLITRVDVSGSKAAFADLSSTVLSSTAQMVGGFNNASLSAEKLEATIVDADSTLADSMLLLTGAVQRLTASIGSIPVATQKATAESRSALSSLEAKLVETAEAGKLSAAGIGGAFSGLSALLGGGLIAGFAASFLDQTAKAVLELGHLSEKTGISISALSGLQLATRELGVEFGAVEQGMIRLERAQTLAVEGGKGQTAAFQRLGITLQELKNSTPEELLNKISEAIQRSGSSADVAASAIALLGRGGAALIPIFKEYGGTLDDVMRKNGENNGVTEQAYQEALKFQKITADLTAELRHLAIEALPLVVDGGKVFAGMLDNISGALLKGTVYLREFAQDAVAIATSDPAGAIGAISLNADQASESIGKIDARTKGLVDSLALFQKDKPKADDPFGIHGLIKDLGLLNNVPTGEGKDPTAKLGEKAAAYKDQLESQLAALSAHTAGQKVLYEQQAISGQQWVAAVEQATEAAFAAENNYFTKLKALYAADPVKLAAINAEQTKISYSALARSEDELAASTKKLNDETREYVAQSEKAEAKDQEAAIKGITKAILDRAAAVKELVASEKTLSTAQGKDQFQAEIDGVKEAAAARIINKRQEAAELDAIYTREKTAAIDALQSDIAADQEKVASAKSTMEQMAALYGPGSPAAMEAQAMYDQDLANYNNMLARKLDLETQYDKKIAAANASAEKEMAASLDRYVSQFQSSVNSLLESVISGNKNIGQAIGRMLTSAAMDIVKAGEAPLKKELEQQLANIFQSKIGGGLTAGIPLQPPGVSQSTIASIAGIPGGAGSAASAASTAPLTTAGTTLTTAGTTLETAATSLQAAATALTSAAGTQQGSGLGQAAGATGDSGGGGFLGFLSSLSSFLPDMAAFDEGGVVPRTAMAMLHENERVATPDMWDEIANMKQGGGSSSNLTLNYHDRRSMSSVDTHGLHDLLAQRPRALGQLVESLSRSGHLDTDAMRQHAGY